MVGELPRSLWGMPPGTLVPANVVLQEREGLWASQTPNQCLVRQHDATAPGPIVLIALRRGGGLGPFRVGMPVAEVEAMLGRGASSLPEDAEEVLRHGPFLLDLEGGRLRIVATRSSWHATPPGWERGRPDGALGGARHFEDLASWHGKQVLAGLRRVSAHVAWSVLDLRPLLEDELLVAHPLGRNPNGKAYTRRMLRGLHRNDAGLRGALARAEPPAR